MGEPPPQCGRAEPPREGCPLAETGGRPDREGRGEGASAYLFIIAVIDGPRFRGCVAPAAPPCIGGQL